MTQAAPTTTASVQGTTTAPGALQAEANAAATGDIPDNQVFLTFHNGGTGYTVKYPEGWAQSGSGASVTFRDKNNIIRILVSSSPKPTAAALTHDLAASHASVTAQPAPVPLPGGTALKAVYRSQSAPNAVTAKRVTLMVDRYVFWHAGQRAVVDLGTPLGVDNVDAYRLIAQSFRWK